MGSCLTPSGNGDVLDISNEYEPTSFDTPPNDNNIHKTASINPLPITTTRNIKITTKNLHKINKHESICSNSSGSQSSQLPDEITPHFNTIPSQSHTYSQINANTNINNNNGTPTTQILEIINDMNEFPDNYEINDKHITNESNSDEVIEVNNNKNESDSNSNILNSEEEEEEEPLPNENENENEFEYNFKNEIETENDIIEINELENIKYKCIQSASATKAGTSKGKSKPNQDSFILEDSFGPSNLFQLYGVCDGHGPSGNNVSKYVCDNLPVIINELLIKNINKLSIQNIIKKSFALIEEQLLNLQSQNKINFDINYSGTTATIGMVAGNKLYVANIGDSRTVLGRIPPNNKTVPQSIALSHDHDPNNSIEMKRICETKTAQILFDDCNDARIQISIPEIIQNTNLLSISNGNTNSQSKHRRTASQVRNISASVSRSIGDVIAHKFGGLISEPEIIIHSLTSNDIFVIFASDGIWQMIDNDDVMRTVGTKLNQNKNIKIYSDLQNTTNKLVREANISWMDEYEDYTDDITAVIARIGKV